MTWEQPGTAAMCSRPAFALVPSGGAGTCTCPGTCTGHTLLPGALLTLEDGDMVFLPMVGGGALYNHHV